MAAGWLLDLKSACGGRRVLVTRDYAKEALRNVLAMGGLCRLCGVSRYRSREHGVLFYWQEAGCP
jgi:hypothetical protein